MDCSAVVILSAVDKKKKKKNVYSSERFQIISDAHNNFDFILSFDFNIEIFKKSKWVQHCNNASFEQNMFSFSLLCYYILLYC